MSETRLVYSTDGNNNCPNCQKLLHKCHCSKAIAAVTAMDGVIRIRLESKGRRGKPVTIVSGLSLSVTELNNTAKQLKVLCGAGGAIKQDCIEIQGDKRELIKTFFENRNETAKLAGG